MSKYPRPSVLPDGRPPVRGRVRRRTRRSHPERDATIERLTKYQRLLCVTDSISGMTDGFAVELFQRLSGIKLPT